METIFRWHSQAHGYALHILVAHFLAASCLSFLSSPRFHLRVLFGLLLPYKTLFAILTLAFLPHFIMHV